MWNSSLQNIHVHFLGYLFKNNFLVLKKIFKEEHYVENLDVGGSILMRMMIRARLRASVF